MYSKDPNLRPPLGEAAATNAIADGRRRSSSVADRFGRNVFRARRRAGFSQQDLSQRCGLHRTHIGYIEHGTRLPRVDTLLKLAAALEVRPEELLRGLVEA